MSWAGPRRGKGLGLLDGKVALVTGGGSGIGRSVVQRFIKEGAQVGVLERVAQRVDELKSDFGPSLIAVCGDVSRTQDNEAVVEQTVSAFGGLDIFVGNAGVFDMFTLLADIPKDKLSEAFDEQFSINVKGLLLGAKASVDALGKTGGCMVLTASVASLNSGGGGVLYTASKHAVLGMIRQLAVELAPRIRVNGVAPGGVVTNLRGLATLDQHRASHWEDPALAEKMRLSSPLRMALGPDDLAGTYLFLACPELSGTITGEVVLNDTGTSLPWWGPNLPV